MKAFFLSSLPGALSIMLAATGLLLAGCQDHEAAPPQPKTPPPTVTITYPPGVRVVDRAYFERIMNGEDPNKFPLANPQPASAYLPRFDPRVTKRDTSQTQLLFPSVPNPPRSEPKP